MKKNIFPYLVCIGSIVIIVSFFMPWATVATSVMGVSKDVTGALANAPIAGKVLKEVSAVTDAVSQVGDISIKNTVSGYQIPKLVNDESSKVALSVAEIFFPDAKDMDVKSYLVYVLPVLGIICAILAFMGQGARLFTMAMVVLGGGVGFVGLYKLYTTDMSSLVVKVVIKSGLWNTMYAFLFIALVGVVWLVTSKDG